jgi:hypothetical protein
MIAYYGIDEKEAMEGFAASYRAGLVDCILQEDGLVRVKPDGEDPYLLSQEFADESGLGWSSNSLSISSLVSAATYLFCPKNQRRKPIAGCEHCDEGKTCEPYLFIQLFS